MTTQKEQTQDAKMIQLALYREYGFQPCLKDIEILESTAAPAGAVKLPGRRSEALATAERRVIRK